VSLERAGGLVGQWLAALGAQDRAGGQKRSRPVCLSHGWSLAKHQEGTSEWARSTALRVRDPGPLLALLRRYRLEPTRQVEAEAGGTATLAWLVEWRLPPDWDVWTVEWFEQELLALVEEQDQGTNPGSVKAASQ
jgi:hypothetical protein